MNTSPLISFALILGLSSCTTISSYRVIKQNGAKIRYELPNGWIVQKIEPPADYYNIISPKSATKPSDTSITIDFYNQFDFRFPQTEAGCAASYLDATQGHKDPAVRMSVIGSIHSPIYGHIAIFNFSSDYFGDHLVSIIVAQGGYVMVELWARTTEERLKYTQPFQEVVRGLSVER